MTTGIHLDIADDAVDVEAGEWEDLRELSVLQLSFEEEDLAFTRADMAISRHNVASLVDHKASFVNIDILASLIFAEEQLDVASAITIEDTHDFLQFKCLAIVVEELRHQAAKLTELFPVKALDAILVNDTALLVY